MTPPPLRLRSFPSCHRELRSAYLWCCGGVSRDCFRYRSRRSRRPHHHRPRIRLHRRCRTIADTSRRLGAEINIFRSIGLNAAVCFRKSVDCIFSRSSKFPPRNTKRKRRRSSRNRASRRLSTPLKFFPPAFWPQSDCARTKRPSIRPRLTPRWNRT